MYTGNQGTLVTGGNFAAIWAQQWYGRACAFIACSISARAEKGLGGFTVLTWFSHFQTCRYINFVIDLCA